MSFDTLVDWDAPTTDERLMQLYLNWADNRGEVPTYAGFHKWLRERYDYDE